MQEMHVQCMQIYENVDDVARANRANNKKYLQNLDIPEAPPKRKF